MNISPDQKKTGLQNYAFPAAKQTPAASNSSKLQSLGADSFSLSSDLEELMRQTGASRITETTYTRTVYMNSQTSIKGAGAADGSSSAYEMYSNCACCYTYMERTLTIESDRIEGGIMTITGSMESASFSLDMKGRSSSMSFDGDSLTDGMREKIRELMSSGGGTDMLSGMERFNKCAGLILDVFGTDMSDLMLDSKGCGDLFGPLDADEDSYLAKSFERLDALREYMSRLTKRMEEILKGLRENGEAGGMKAFSAMYFKLEVYSYSELTALTDKALEGKQGEAAEAEKGASSVSAALKYEKYTYSEIKASSQRVITASGENKPEEKTEDTKE